MRIPLGKKLHNDLLILLEKMEFDMTTLSSKSPYSIQVPENIKVERSYHGDIERFQVILNDKTLIDIHKKSTFLSYDDWTGVNLNRKEAGEMLGLHFEIDDNSDDSDMEDAPSRKSNKMKR